MDRPKNAMPAVNRRHSANTMNSLSLAQAARFDADPVRIAREKARAEVAKADVILAKERLIANFRLKQKVALEATVAKAKDKQVRAERYYARKEAALIAIRNGEI